MSTARHVRLFRNGRNQALRIPRELELPGHTAALRKEGGRLIVEPAAGSALLSVLAKLKPPDEELPPIARARAGGNDLRAVAQPLDQVVDEPHRAGAWHAGPLVDARQQDVRRVVAGVDAHQRGEAPSKQRRADQKERRERRFDDQQAVTRAAAAIAADAAAGRSVTRIERPREIESRAAPRRHESRDERRDAVVPSASACAIVT